MKTNFEPRPFCLTALALLTLALAEFRAHSAAPLPNAWQITDNSAAGGSLLYYTNLLSDAHRTAATNQGFRFSVHGRFVADFGGSKTMAMLYGLGTQRYQLWWYLDNNNDLVAELQDGPSFLLTTNGTGSLYYHTHELIYDPGSRTASYVVDGVLMISNVAPNPIDWPAGTVTWGAGSSAGKGRMNFQRVSFEITNTAVALYDAGVAGSPPQAPDPATNGWVRYPASPMANTGATRVSPDAVPLPAPPIAITSTVTGMQPYQAFLAGSADPRGLSSTVWFEWGETIPYGNVTPVRSLLGGAQNSTFTENITGLSKGVPYHFRCVASNHLGVAFGQDVVFVTPLQFSVTTLANVGYGSLRNVVGAARPGDIITFATNGTITFISGGEVLLSKDLTLAGPGPTNLVINGNGASRVFQISTGAVVSISGITIRNGKTPDGVDSSGASVAGGSAAHGGGIFNSGTLHLSNCVVTANRTGNGGLGWTAGAGSGTPGTAGGNGGSGGGIYNLGILTLVACTLSGNNCGGGGQGGRGANGTVGSPDGTVGGLGGEGGDGGGIYNLGQLSLTNCTMNNNQAGAGAEGGDGGDAIITLIHDGGNAGAGGAGGIAGGLFNDGDLLMWGCTVSSNRAGLGGVGGSGGLQSFSFQAFAGRGGRGGSGGHAGGIFNANMLTLITCTVAHNTSGRGGDGGLSRNGHGGAGWNGGNGGGIYNSGQLTFIACSLSRNVTGKGGDGGDSDAPNADYRSGDGGDGGSGGAVWNSSTAVFASLRNTLVASNAFGLKGAAGRVLDAGTNGLDGVNGLGPDLRGAFLSDGYNLVGKSDGAGLAPVTGTDLIFPPGQSLNPSLGPLAHNGGETMTTALLPGSPAINAGDNALPATVPTDQRGYLRSSGGRADIGAFEVQVADPANPPRIAGVQVEGDALMFSFTNNPGLQFQVLASTNVALPLNQWVRIGPASEPWPGQYVYIDATATYYPRRFYKVVWP